MKRRFFRGTIVLVTLVALFYTVENWRGARAWSRVKASLEARGEPLTVEQLLPPVPDAENFFEAPVIASRYRASSTDWFKFKKGSLADIHGEAYRGGSSPNLKAALKLLRENADWPLPAETGRPGADLLAALAPAEKNLRELREAVRRPRAAMLISQFDPQDATRGARFLIETVRLHALRRLALLEENRRDEAADECLQAMRLARCLALRPPNMMQFLIAGASTGGVLSMLRTEEGAIPWTAPQLQAMDAELSALQFGERFGDVLRAERIFALTWIERFASGAAGAALGESPAAAKLLPPGWRYLWQATLCEAIQERLDGIAASGLRAEMAITREHGWFPPQPFAIRGDEMKTYESLMPRALVLDQSVAATRIALAAQRWRLEKGTWPESLSSLASLFPSGVPVDPVSAQPFTISAAADGTCTVQPPVNGSTPPDEDSIIRLKPPAVSR